MVEGVHRAHLCVEPIDGMGVLLDASEHVGGLLREQVLEGRLDDVALGGEVIEQRGPLHAELLRQAREGEIEPFGGKDGDRLASEITAFVELCGARHCLTNRQITVS